MSVSLNLLPYELRTRVYDFLFSKAEIVIPITNEGSRWQLPSDIEYRMTESRRLPSLMLSCRQTYKDLADTFYERVPLRLWDCYVKGNLPSLLDSLEVDIEFLWALMAHSPFRSLFSKARVIKCPERLIRPWQYILEQHFLTYPNPSLTYHEPLSFLHELIFLGHGNLDPVYQTEPRIEIPNSTFIFYRSKLDIELEIRRDATLFRSKCHPPNFVARFRKELFHTGEVCEGVKAYGSGVGEVDVVWWGRRKDDYGFELEGQD